MDNTNTNPDLVDVADEAFGVGLPAQIPTLISVPVTASPNNVVGVAGNTRPIVVDQEIQVGPTQVHRLNLDGGGSSVKTVVVDQEIGVGPSQNAGPTTQGGNFKPGNANIRDKTEFNRIADQTYGTGTPTNVFV